MKDLSPKPKSLEKFSGIYQLSIEKLLESELQMVNSQVRIHVPVKTKKLYY